MKNRHNPDAVQPHTEIVTRTIERALHGGIVPSAGKLFFRLANVVSDSMRRTYPGRGGGSICTDPAMLLLKAHRNGCVAALTVVSSVPELAHWVEPYTVVLEYLNASIAHRQTDK